MARCEDLKRRAQAAVRRALRRPERVDSRPSAVVTDARGRVIAHIHIDLLGMRKRVKCRKPR